LNKTIPPEEKGWKEGDPRNVTRDQPEPSKSASPHQAKELRASKEEWSTATTRQRCAGGTAAELIKSCPKISWKSHREESSPETEKARPKKSY